MATQQPTKGRPVLSAARLINEHFESVAAEEAELQEMERLEEIYSPHTRIRFIEFDDDDLFDRDHEQTSYFYDPPLPDYDDTYYGMDYAAREEVYDEFDSW